MPNRPGRSTCLIDGCDNDVEARGWCMRHYSTWRRHGNPEWTDRRRSQVICSIEGCGEKKLARGWCSRHYDTWRFHGDPEWTDRRREQKLCSVEGCNKPKDKLTWCGMHYRRWKRHGSLETDDPRFMTREEAFRNRTRIVGGCLIWTGSLDRFGYAKFAENEYVHRWVWERSNGPIPEGMLVDHKFRCNGNCVEITHLRLATRSQNNSNRSGANRGNKLGVRNVYLVRSKFQVRVSGVYIGTSEKIDDAKKAARDARERIFGEFAGTG